MSGCCAWGSDGAFVPVEDFLPDVKAVIPAVPDVLAANAVRMAAIELCQRVPFVVRDALLDTQAGVADYPLALPDSYVVTGVLGLMLGGRTVPLLPPSAFPARGAVYHRGERLLVLNPAPSVDAPGCLHARVSVMPGQLSCHLPREVFDEALDVVAAGALARLLLIPKTSWADKSTAGVYRTTFSAGVGRISNLALRGGVSGPIVMQARRFF